MGYILRHGFNRFFLFVLCCNFMYIFTKFSWLKYNCQAVVDKEKKNQLMLRRGIESIHSIFFTRITRYFGNVWLSHADVYYLIFSIFSVICVLLTIFWTLQKKKNLGIHPKDSRVSLALKFFLTSRTRPRFAGFWIHLDLPLYHRLAKNTGGLFTTAGVRTQGKAEHQVSPARWL